jgi:hypothetical protein
MPGMPLTINCVHSPKILTKGYQLPYVILVNHRGISHDNPFGPILDSSNFEGPNSSCNGFFGEGIHIPDWGQTSFGTHPGVRQMPKSSKSTIVWGDRLV